MIEFENCVLSVSEKIEQWLGLKINRDKTRIYEVKGGRQIWRQPDTWYRSGLRRTWVRPRRKRKERSACGGGSTGRKTFFRESGYTKNSKAVTVVL
jgi:hypothetical protein